MAKAATRIGWTIGGVIAVAVLVMAGAFLARTPLIGSLLSGNPIETTSETTDRQVVNAVERTGEVALLSLAIQGIEQRSDSSTLFGVTIPGSDRVVFMQYSFTAKLGLDGEQVEIEQTGENAYRVRFPEFVVIGFNEPNFEVAVQDGGVLSWTTPEIDTTEMANAILSPDSIAQHIDGNRDALQDQAASFYSSLIAAIDPDISVDFQFATGD